LQIPMAGGSYSIQHGSARQSARNLAFGAQVNIAARTRR
jgi:hypothetical protein